MKRTLKLFLALLTVLLLFSSTLVGANNTDPVADTEAPSSTHIIGDVTNDGLVKSLDAAMILRYDANLSSAESIGTKVPCTKAVKAFIDENLHLWVEFSDGKKINGGYAAEKPDVAGLSYVGKYAIVGDTNGDGKITALDAAMTLRYDAGLSSTDIMATKVSGNTVVDAYIDDASHCWVVLSDGGKLDAGYVGAKTYTVTFVDYDGTVLKTETVESGSAATAPAAPVREGYTFTGWDKTFDNITENTTVTATYESIKYTVNFVDFDGTLLKSETVDKGASVSAPADPTREGFRFIGWNGTAANVTADMTITAQYVQQFSVTFVDYNGTVLKTETVENGKSATAPTAPTRPYYTFLGWDKSFVSVTSDLVVNAMYEENTHTVTYYNTKGNVVPSQYTTYSEKDGLHLPDEDTITLTAEGYTFAGWYTQSEGGEMLDDIPVGGSVTKLYAHWDATKYTITYKDIGKTTNPTEYTVEQEITLSPAEWSGLAFKNWTNENGEAVTKVEKGSTGNITLYANWIYEENMAVPSGNSEITSVVYDAEKNRYYFVYDLGVIDNIVLETIGSNDKSVGMELTLGKAHTTNVEKTTADTIANTISHSISQTEEWSNNFIKTESNEISFDIGASLEAKDIFKIEASLGISNSTETSREYGQGGSVSEGGETSDSVSSTVSYTVGTSLTVETGYVIPIEMPAGTYNYVCVGKAHVYGVVIYDPSDGKYYLDTYSILDEKLREKVLYEAPSNSTANISYSEGLPFDAYASEAEIVEKLNSVFYVKYDPNGGEGEMLCSVHTIGEQKSLLKNNYKFTGHVFMGWSTTENGSVVYTDEETIGTIASSDETVTLHAVWQIIPYTVNWNSGIGYTITVNRTTSPLANAPIGKLNSGDKVYYGDTLEISYTNSIGYTITSSGEKSITVVGDISAQNISATAQANQYTVEYNANGGTGSTSSSIHTYDQSKPLSNNCFTRAGWTFIGWSTSSSATTATYTNGQSVKNLISQSNGKVTLYAVWTLVVSNNYSFDAFFVNNTISGANGYYVDLSNIFDMQALKNQGYTMNVSMNFSLVSVDVGSDGKYEYNFNMFNSTADTGFKLYEGANSSISSGTHNMSYNNIVSIAANQLTNNNLGFLFYENTYTLLGIKTNEYKVVGLVMTVTFTK